MKEIRLNMGSMGVTSDIIIEVGFFKGSNVPNMAYVIFLVVYTVIISPWNALKQILEYGRIVNANFNPYKYTLS